MDDVDDATATEYLLELCDWFQCLCNTVPGYDAICVIRVRCLCVDTANGMQVHMIKKMKMRECKEDEGARMHRYRYRNIDPDRPNRTHLENALVIVLQHGHLPLRTLPIASAPTY